MIPVVPFTFPFYLWAHPSSVMGPEWHLPPSLLCSCLVCPCHEKLHHITAHSHWHTSSTGMPGLLPVTSAAPAFLPSLTACMGIVGTSGRTNGAGSIPTPAAPPHCRGAQCLCFLVHFWLQQRTGTAPAEQLMFRRGLLLHPSLP